MLTLTESNNSTYLAVVSFCSETPPSTLYWLWLSHLLQLGLGWNKFSSLSSLTTLSPRSMLRCYVKGPLFCNLYLFFFFSWLDGSISFLTAMRKYLAEHLRGSKYRFEGPVHYGEECVAGRMVQSIMVRKVWLEGCCSIGPQSGSREVHASARHVLSFYLFYSVQNPSPWDAAAYIQSGSSLQLNRNTQRCVSQVILIPSSWQWTLTVTPEVTGFPHEGCWRNFHLPFVQGCMLFTWFMMADVNLENVLLQCLSSFRTVGFI